MEVKNLVSIEKDLMKRHRLKVIFSVNSRFSADSDFSLIKTIVKNLEFFGEDIWLVFKIRSYSKLTT